MNFNSQDLINFDKRLQKAIGLGQEHFTFRGETILTSYGKYMSEYLHSELDDGRRILSRPPAATQ